MAKANFRTWVTDETVTADQLNEQIRDNGNANWVGTNAGDMDYYSDATNKARIPIGTEGQVLKVISGSPTFGIPLSFANYIISGSMTLTASAYTAINKWQAVNDVNGWLDADKTKFNLSAGIYIVNMQYYFSPIHVGKTFWAMLYKNHDGVDSFVSWSVFKNEGDMNREAFGAIYPVIVNIAEGDYLHIKITQGNDSTNATLYHYPERTYLNILKLA